jgi:DNA replication protein DnaC
MSAAQRCDCALAGRASWLEEQANIPLLYQNASVENFVLPPDNPTARSGLGSAMRTVKSFVREYPSGPKPGLLFLGHPGCGKTHLAVAALRGLLARGFEGIFFDFQNLLDRIRSSYDKASGTTDKEAYRTALDTEIIVLDDLGAHRVTDWVEDTITAIITHRCNNRKATLITSNLRDPKAGDRRATGLEEDIQSKYFLEERIGARARSRLFEMCLLIEMPVVEDYRMRKRN